MDRREAIRALAGAAFLPLASVSELSGLHAARLALDCAPPRAPGLLTETELEIVAAVGDVILPRTDTPSASDVGVPEFIDVMVTEWLDPPEADDFRAGLAALDARARETAGAGFAAASPEVRHDLVAALDVQMAAERSAGRGEGSFFHRLKQLTLTGYFTSEEGMALLGERVVPGRFEGCLVPGDAR